MKKKELEQAYAAMAADEAGECEALEWAEGLTSDIAEEMREVDKAIRTQLAL